MKNLGLKTAAWIAAMIPAFAAAQSAALGTKPNLTTPPPAASGALVGPWEILQLLGALALVGALIKWGLPWLITKSRSNRIGKGHIIVHETAAVGAGHLHVVEVEGRRLLVGSTAQSIALVSELNLPHITIQSGPISEVENDDEPAFFELVDEKMDEPEPAKPARTIAKGKAVIQREVVPDDDEEGLSFEEALALITQAKRRTGAEEPAPKPAAKPAAKRTSKVKPVPVQELTEEEINAALERIKNLTR